MEIYLLNAAQITYLPHHQEEEELEHLLQFLFVQFNRMGQTLWMWLCPLDNFSKITAGTPAFCDVCHLLLSPFYKNLI